MVPDRITPTYAGSTVAIASHTRDATDHPHLRGEHKRREFQISTLQGSPPPTRGARLQGDGGHGEARITPTYAGSTGRGLGGRPLTADHPHLRGEHVFRATEGMGRPGSPPPTRGARFLISDITPSLDQILGSRAATFFAFRSHSWHDALFPDSSHPVEVQERLSYPRCLVGPSRSAPRNLPAPTHLQASRKRGPVHWPHERRELLDRRQYGFSPIPTSVLAPERSHDRRKPPAISREASD